MVFNKNVNKLAAKKITITIIKGSIIIGVVYLLFH